MFNIETKKFGNYNKIILSNRSSQEYVSIIPDSGANINELFLSNGIKIFDLVDGDKTPEELLINDGFKGCKLLPFPNRIKNGEYQFEDKTYFLEKNNPPHALHGLLLYKTYKVDSSHTDSDAAELNLSYIYDNENIGYPFQFETKINIRLDQSGLTKTTTIKNLGTSPLPIGDGWHLYFKMENNSINETALTLPSSHQLIADETLIPTGKSIEFDEFRNSKLIKDQHFDDCFALENNNSVAKIILTDQKNNYSIIAWQKTGFNQYNFTQIYTPKHRKSIAIEPMTCQPNAFNSKEGLILLQPMESIQLICGVTISKA
ncbi:MAG: aldose 1-epimerase [Cytophagales bacterium]|nr:MAG: aldose 1-epimerase [Cytophagales bacterium]